MGTALITDHSSSFAWVWLQVFVVTAGGCSWNAPAAAPETGPRWRATHPDLLAENVFRNRRDTAPEGSDAALTPEVALQVYYEIWRFRAAGGEVSGLDPLWDHLDEAVPVPEQTMLLRRNGIRVGVGKESSWPAVREIVLQSQPQVWRTEGGVAQGETIHVDLGELEENVPLFHFDGDGGLVGSRSSGGTMTFRIEHELSMEELDRLSFRITPQLRRESSSLSRKLQREAGDRGEDDGESFDDLACTVVIRPGQYIIIGPSLASGMAHLVGSVFLVSREASAVHENLYCIVPRIYRWMPTRTKDAAGGEGSGDDTGAN